MITPKELKEYAENCLSLTDDMLESFIHEGKSLSLDTPDRQYLIIAIMATIKDVYRKGEDDGWKNGLNDSKEFRDIL
jgi:hypothetical protein